jgi:hypothetical protein
MVDLNTNFNTDYDSFLIDSPDIKPVPMLTPQSSVPASTSTPTFPGPSFQYDLYHQQTGIPRGALASTFSINKATGLQYHESNGGFIMPTETLNMPLSDLDDLDFSRNPADMDFDDSPIGLPTMFFPDTSSGPAQFVSPNTLVTPTNTSSTPIKRIYPGMHSQQAAQAKAQQAQKQEQMARQQQQRPQGQKPLPASSPTKTQPAKDPLVEESISKVLNRMRQASAASVSEDDDGALSGMSNMPRIKKDEDEMDEDERLLASEEGKKLSSKERRQLRNKVSARAFRSRRKEYIGQLEGEVATKVQEANDLRVQNQQLREENNRLTDLTRMLLSSQAFSGFLQELSQSGLPPPNLQKNMQQPKPVQTQPQSQPQPMKKDVSSNAASQQPQIGMALIPETPVDFSVLQPSNGWMNVLPTNDYHVYAVTELPTPPMLDLESLSGKTSSTKGSSKASKEVPRLPELPPPMVTSTPVEVSKVDESVTLDPDSFALYFNSSDSDIHCSSEGEYSTLAEEYANISEEECMANLKKMCGDLDDSCVKLAKFTSHME